jgi:S1-C subfamily serine protease
MILRCLLCTFLLTVAIDIAGCTAPTAPGTLARAAAPSTRPPERSGNADCTEPIPSLFERVSPSVVSIAAVGMDRFEAESGIKNVVGSGFIISDDGLVLTNSHVVFDRQAISVTLDDGRRSQAVLLGADPIYDLAVLRISDPRRDAPKAVLGDSDRVRIGEDVVAIGNPLALEQTLTRGVVSGLNRFGADSPFSLALPLIQTDASINPGNSGGPLFNRCGEAIGITTLMAADAQNIGFAVPINIARQFVPELVRNGRIVRPWFGMSVKPVSRELVEFIKFPLVEGLLVEKVDSGSPAQRAGIRDGSLPVAIAGSQFLLGGDIITDMNGQSPLDPDRFAEMVDALHVGDSVRLTLFRDGHRRQVTFTLVERPQLPGDFRPSPFNTMLRFGHPTGKTPR